jgi:hypothetical protein
VSDTDLLLLLVGSPIAAILGGIAGRHVQRWMWKLDQPYEERVRALKP